ncbi:hypothetical protein AB0A74_05345 [Saccharothrix sp. NPDC042600]|uniref:hypothetical protein n=1 Tax=Saccharothrix TaxID=2071 RepID=UPI0033FCACD5|nr:hypothetical protein GCM10017745_37260 [Saccharothrix mutabilis subsp. capreolus]
MSAGDDVTLRLPEELPVLNAATSRMLLAILVELTTVEVLDRPPRVTVTAEISRDPWTALDELMGVEVVDSIEDGIGPVAFYGRCSTEDNQDPETSLGWQLGNARKFVEPLGGVVTAEFFDVGQSRSVPWERREEAPLLLGALNPDGSKYDERNPSHKMLISAPGQAHARCMARLAAYPAAMARRRYVLCHAARSVVLATTTGRVRSRWARAVRHRHTPGAFRG